MNSRFSNFTFILFIFLLTFLPLKTFAAAKGMYEIKTSSKPVSSSQNSMSLPGMMSALTERDVYQMHYDVLPEMKAVIGISKKFFSGLILKNVDTATKPLFKIFPISVKSKNHLKNDIKNLESKVGPMLEAEYIGYRTIGKMKRYFNLYFITYHAVMPIVWELTFYQPMANGKWQLNFIRFNSDNPYEFLKYPQLKLNLIQKLLKK